MKKFNRKCNNNMRKARQSVKSAPSNKVNHSPKNLVYFSLKSSPIPENYAEQLSIVHIVLFFSLVVKCTDTITFKGSSKWNSLPKDAKKLYFCAKLSANN